MIVKYNKYFLNIFIGIAFLVLAIGAQGLYAGELGRLFTTPAERKMLDDLRYNKPEPVVETIVIVEEPEEPEEEIIVKPEIGSIQVKGLVYRKDGKSTAWVNDSNTYEGDLSTQYIDIDAIDPDRVKIKIPVSESEITLKVGQGYNPSTEEKTDLSDILSE